MPFNVNDPAVLKFFVENYEKESFRRMAWSQRYQKEIANCAKFKREPKNYFDTDVRAHTLKYGMITLTNDFISSGRNRYRARPNDAEIKGIETLRHGHSIVDVKLGDPKKDPRLIHKEGDLCFGPVMRPVDPADTAMIYQAEPLRSKYLEKRYKIMPEDRFYFAECSSWDYGWRLKDNKNLPKPMYPRYALLMRTLENRVSASPDPPHYKSSMPDGFCV